MGVVVLVVESATLVGFVTIAANATPVHPVVPAGSAVHVKLGRSVPLVGFVALVISVVLSEVVRSEVPVRVASVPVKAVAVTLMVPAQSVLVKAAAVASVPVKAVLATSVLLGIGVTSAAPVPSEHLVAPALLTASVVSPGLEIHSLGTAVVRLGRFEIWEGSKKAQTFHQTWFLSFDWVAAS